MKKFLSFLLIIVLGLGTGAGISILLLNHWVKGQESTEKNGCWRTVSTLGTNVGLIDRARVSVSGLFALSKKEVVYFIGSHDENGDPLMADKNYIIEGKDMDARFWSITAYASDFFLIPNPEKIFSFNDSNVDYGENRQFKIHLSPKKQEGDWLPTGNKKQRIYLNLRLYNPSPSISDNLETTPLPIIKEIKE